MGQPASCPAHKPAKNSADASFLEDEGWPGIIDVSPKCSKDRGYTFPRGRDRRVGIDKWVSWLVILFHVDMSLRVSRLVITVVGRGGVGWGKGGGGWQ